MGRAQDNLKQARSEAALQQARKEWFQLRVAQIHRHVSAYEVLRRHGIELRGTATEEQFSCPFHGTDRKPSARIYPESATSPSHVWCFVCQERWDTIGLWCKFNGDEPFARAVAQIEQTYGLSQIEVPEGLDGGAPAGPSPQLLEFQGFFTACENRLRLAKPFYVKLNDMVGYLSASSVLDKIRWRVEQRQVDPERGGQVLTQLLGKISEKVQAAQACPDE